MATKPQKPNRPDDMRTKQGKEKYTSVPNRDKVVPKDLPHPESMKSKKEVEVDHHKHDDNRQ